MVTSPPAGQQSLPRCDQSPVSTDYFVAACVARGMEMHRDADGTAAARSKANDERSKLTCSPDSLYRLDQSANLSASRILSSGAITGLMDFSDAMNLECKKAAAAVLNQ